MHEVPLAGGGSTRVHRRGNVVLREPRRWSRTVLALLRHIEREGFAGAPQVLGAGFDDAGREMLSFIEGESPAPYAWSDDAAFYVGRLLRELHDATATFVPPPDAVWMPSFCRELVGRRPLIGHCDTAPWNILARDGRPVAFVDWDSAGPFDAWWELAHTAWLNAQLHDDDVAKRLGLPDLGGRARQLRAIVDGYRLPARERTGFVDAMVEIAVRSAAQEAIDGGVTPNASQPAPFGKLGGGPPLEGHDLLWAVTWRIRGAAWMLRNRRTLERALA
jgi:hypothetical protein